jgi:hypothetical protein
MKHSRRIALIAFLIALLIILAVGFYRASMHEEARPEASPTSASSS